jgi:hypothetical protein
MRRFRRASSWSTSAEHRLQVEVGVFVLRHAGGGSSKGNCSSVCTSVRKYSSGVGEVNWYDDMRSL